MKDFELLTARYTNGPDQSVRLVAATSDPAPLPAETTWYQATNRVRPGSVRAQEGPVPPAEREESVRLYGLRNWVEQSNQQARQELGRADFQVGQDLAMRRHWGLVCCAFAFCWWARFYSHDEPRGPAGSRRAVPGTRRDGARGVERSTEQAGGGGSGAPREAARTQPRARETSVPWPVALHWARGWLTPWQRLWRW